MAGSPALARQLQVAVEAARSAGAVIAAAFHRPKRVEHKGPADLVTDTDRRCEALVLDAIRASFPDHQFIGEEASADAAAHLTDAPTWMVDPLDGTTNFVHGYPFVAVSIALVVNRAAVVGVVYNPVLEEMFTATAGGGAFLNGEPIRPSDTSDPGSALLGTELGVQKDDATLGAVFGRVRDLSKITRSLRCGGSCAIGLCNVACGRLDAFYEIGFGGCWDVAAGALIVQEAGGVVVDPAGGPYDVMARRVLAGNGHLTGALSAVIRDGVLGPKEPAAPGS
ncbi:unnamed protein product [Ostreobium quekettii]|uniref:Inositol-1-monophosphatase n=1 Tax=Ostreobium quekettii TaxID=121088 RepID=A0A8S1J4L9_9CHLO|nr:unnamed protein product [Ostreobium quekettii]|eukprot:evm.model.scf_131.18 EVM.evm.TU.scf_131.18   scf_131:113268-114110(+)